MMTYDLEERIWFMVDFDPSTNFLVSANQKKRLTLLQRRENENIFEEIYSLNLLSGIPTSVCWVTQELIMVGLALTKSKAKIQIISFKKTEIQEPVQLSKKSLDQHTANVEAIIAQRNKDRMYSQSFNEIIIWRLESLILPIGVIKCPGNIKSIGLQRSGPKQEL